MSSTSLDPVQTIVDVLEDADATAGDWSNAGSAPDHIERYEETDFSRKKRRDVVDAVYVQGGEATDYAKLGAGFDTLIDQPTVRVEIWTPTGSDTCHQYALDVREIVRGYTVDNENQTRWTDISPAGEEDLRDSARARGVDHAVMAVLVDLVGAR